MPNETTLSRRSLGALAAVSVAAVAAARTGKVNYHTIKSLLQSTLTGPGSASRIVAILVVLANFKNFPLVWHVRVLGAFFKHLKVSSHKFTPTSNGPSSLFQPTISTTRSPITECDYNIHKSNSTYFSDLDVSRSNLVCILFRDGLKELALNPKVVGPDGTRVRGKCNIALGAVQCNFKHQIAPYEAYEMWTRVLCWDRKWLYIVTHFVKKGAVKPAGYTLQAPWSHRFAALMGRKEVGGHESLKEPTTAAMNGTALEKNIHKDIFASAISKYVCKLGRFTIHPEVVFEASGLLPPKPGGWNTMTGSQPLEPLGESYAEVANGHANGSANPSTVWDWKHVEAENARGMELARHFAALEGLNDTFTGQERPALGVYDDFM